jgi:hypothetical protein
MKTDQHPKVAAAFLQTVSVAMARLKQRLQQEYERSYPELREIIHLVLDQEEAKAWELTLFPHLLLPDLVEAHINNLCLQPAERKHADVLIPHDFSAIPTYQPALALYGSCA